MTEPMMELETALFLSVLAGVTMPLGALLAKVEHISPKWLEKEFRHSIIAFGGGVLLAAVALVLVPEGKAHLSRFWVMATFLSGGGVFYIIDRLLESYGGHYSQLLAMVSDFVPEAMALGALLTGNHSSSLLLALLVAFQNLPEGFNAYREIMERGLHSANKIMCWFCALVIAGPVSAMIGFVYLAKSPEILAGIMLFSAGGILYLIFQDIAPQAHLKHKWAPPLGAVAGFSVGLLGQMVV